MKKMLLLALILWLPTILSAQVYLNENFDNFPPNDWTINLHAANWSAGNSQSAGGEAPEAVFTWEPSFNGTTRLVSPVINLTGVTNLKLKFRHYVDLYQPSVVLGVATRHGQGDWHNVWTINPSADIGPEVIRCDINNSDVGLDSFQICWFFTGISQNINFWYIDDAFLFSPVAHDVGVTAVTLDPQYYSGDLLFIDVGLENQGLNTESFNVNCKIKVGENVVYDSTRTVSNLDSNSLGSVSLPPFRIPASNELYNVIICTQLANDLYAQNDTITGSFNTYSIPRGMVVMEIATGTWCPYCPGAALGAEDMISHGHNVAIVEYHSGGGGDPFINSYGDARCEYYDVQGFPTTYVDGILSYSGGNHTNSIYNRYLPLYLQRCDLKCAFSLNIAASHTGNDYQVQVTIIKHARISYQNIALIMALTESNIIYSWQGQSALHWVERTMAPDQNGTTLDFSTSDTQVVNLTFSKNPTWAFSELEISAFIQNLDDKEILQGTKARLNALTTAIDEEQMVLPRQIRLNGPYPNPFNQSVRLSFSLTHPEKVSLDIYNMLGQKVRTLVKANLDAGEHFTIWDGHNDSGDLAASGTYWVKLNAGNNTFFKKMSLLN